MTNLAKAAAWALAPVMLVVMIAVSNRAYLMSDFHAFYCAGSVVAHGANPYLEEPLHSCETREHLPGLPKFKGAFTLPAPLPPGALAAFVPLAWLPFPVATAVYFVLLVGAMCAAVVLFARVTGVSTIWLNLAFAGITASETLALGQPVPFVFLALAAAAILVRGRRWIAASACAVVATAEPHLALPVLLAMAIALPRTRVPMVAWGLLLGLIGVAAVGLPTSIAYVRDVVPAHALANAYEWQFSLTSILTSFGVAGPAAVAWGEAMYAAMVALGVAAALRVWRALGDPAALVLLPPAFAVFGGVHVHYQQLAIAFPALLYIYARYPRLRIQAATAVTLSMIPWNVLSGSVMTGFTPLLVGWFARATMGARRGLVLAVIAGVIAISVLALALAGFGPGEVHFVAHHYPPDALAEASWSDYSRQELARASVLLQWLRVPVIAGLALGVVAMTRAAFGAPESEERYARNVAQTCESFGVRPYVKSPTR